MFSGTSEVKALATNKTGTVSLSIFPHHMEVKFRVEAENRLGLVKYEVPEMEADCLSEFSSHN